MAEIVQPANAFLDAAYTELGYNTGILLQASSYNEATDEEYSQWFEKGDWLALAREVGAERVFFVDNDPIIVFCSLTDMPTEREISDTFRRVWCMARPQCLFLGLPGELRVYSLNSVPVRSADGGTAVINPLEIVRKVADVASHLQDYRRERVESGLLFADGRFGSVDERADKRLIQDLKVVRQSLLDTGLPAKYVHALIGRSIFIRYLEDRGILTPKYFEQVAMSQPAWEALLTLPSEKPELANTSDRRRYDRVLRSKGFTYALFAQLAHDFNGDMFPQDGEEDTVVNSGQLGLLRRFLLGDSDPLQPSLFFWAYDFRVIPIELISSIYEEFYHRSVVDSKGTHYTPSTLVEYVLSQVLTVARLEAMPKVLDPACGSGIFLVEAFRRIVRHRVHRHNRLLTSAELRTILRTQIVGIEINEEAARVAAFSLYLALLHYQEPPDILASPRLPHLLFVSDEPEDEYHYRVIFHANTFSLTSAEYLELADKASKSGSFLGRARLLRMLEAEKRLPLQLHQADVVIGNPPWFEVGAFLPSVECEYSQAFDRLPSAFKYDEKKGALSIVRELSTYHVADAKQKLPEELHEVIDTLRELSDDCFQADRWASAYGFPVGEKNYSQMFIYRALSLCRPDGVIGLLVHSSVLYNQRNTSRAFRQRWLTSSQLYQVANFVHVRRLFFEQAVAPFVFVCFSPSLGSSTDSRFVYLSMRLSRANQHLRTVLFTKADRRIVGQFEVLCRDYLWKTYWWGSHADASLLAALDAESRMSAFISDDGPRPSYGFQYGAAEPSPILRQLQPLRSENTKWYGPLQESWFEAPPTGVKRQPDERIYQGQRLLVIRGVKDALASFARLEYEPFSFRHTIYCVPLPSLKQWKAKVIVGIFWSSLGRYRMFMTSGSWGTWYDQTVPSDVTSMPIRLPERPTPIVRAVLHAVDQIRAWSPASDSLLLSGGLPAETPPSPAIMEALDEAVFDLFGLSDVERDVIRDFMTSNFSVFAEGVDSPALLPLAMTIKVRQGTLRDIPEQRAVQSQLESYLHTFLEVWNDELQPDGEFGWFVATSPDNTMLAVVFITQEKDQAAVVPAGFGTQEWLQILAICAKALDQEVSRNIFVDGLIRVVTDTQIIVIKRNERRLWTRTAAHEDAQATLLQASYLQGEGQPQG